MRKLLLILALSLPLMGHAQSWTGLLKPTSGAGACSPATISSPQQCAIDWTAVGIVGGIPSGSWTQSGSTISAGASASTVQSALNSCGTNHFVLLGAGAFTFSSDVSIPSHCVLRGSGPQSTVITYTGTTGFPLYMGDQAGSTAPNLSNATNITSGATAGSTSVVVSSASNLATGGLMVVTELNDLTSVNVTTPNGTCTFCDAYLFHNAGTRVRGQTVKITNVSGTTVTFTPALYTAYSNTPIASPYGTVSGSSPDATMAGVENLQLFATNSAPNTSVNGAMISMWSCDECWVKNVENNWADSNHVGIGYCYRCEVDNSYFTNAFVHQSGGSDVELQVAAWSSGVLIQNNILERLHSSIVLEWGIAGNVIADNYTLATFDSAATNVTNEDIAFHGANPQFNLLEGNVTDDINYDAFWGSTTNNTNFRNLIRGVATVCPYTDSTYTAPGPAHKAVNWSGCHLSNQQNRSLTVTFDNTNVNSIGNVYGSQDASTASGAVLYNGSSSPFTSTMAPSTNRIYNGQYVAANFGYNTGADADGSAIASFSSGPGPTTGYWVGLALGSNFQHGNFDIASNSTIWNGSVTHTLPASFYQASKPAWWGSLVYPANGPDVTTGTIDSTILASHAAGNPAYVCYNSLSRDSFGVKLFDGNTCYSSTPSYTWTVTATNGSVTGTNSASGTYSSGTTIGPVTAVPNAGYVFSSWSGVSGSAACSGATNPCPSFSITANSAVTANFVSGGVTVATGDTRTITEPTFPATCSTVQATKYIVSTNAVNIDPFNSTCGSTGGTNGTLGCTGGTSYEPSSTSGSYTAAETLDNSALTSALSACTSGKAVELVPGSSGQLGFVLSPLSLPSGVSLIVDAGIHVFASRNRTDYGGTNCGLVTSGTSGCNHWLTAPSTTGSGIYGYGVLDGRGWDAYIGSTTQGFYSNRIQAYCNNHGGAINGSPACTPNGSGNNSYGPNGLNIVSATNFTLYKTTVRDSGNFIFNWSGGNGLTAWGAKLIAPFEVSNTDGFDPLNSKNGTFTHGIISNGDNHVAVKSTSSSSQNITVSNTQTGAGIAIAIGTDINSPGTSNILFTNLIQRGNLYNSEAAGLQIGSSSANGGLVNIVSFINDCMVNEGNSVRLYTNYGGNSGSLPPQYTNILLRNIHVLPSTSPYTTGNSGFFTFQGLSGLPMGVQVDNFVIDGVNQGVASQSGVTKNQYANIYLGPGAVASSLLTQFAAGTSVTTTGTPGSSTPYACTTSTWQPLVGDLNLKSATSNNNQSYTGPSPFTLQGVLQPATDISTKESPALTQPVTFLRDGVSIGTAPLLGDGSFASFTVSSSPVGTHLYTAQYPGDSYYPSFVFGSITVTNSTPVVTPPSFSVIFAQ